MSKETVTGATVDDTAVPEGEAPVGSAESINQDSTKKLEEFEKQLKEAAEQLEAFRSAKTELEAKAAREEAARQEKLIARLVEQTLDPDAAAQFRREIEAASTAEELERLRTQIAQSQVQQGPPPLTAEYKMQLYDAYFRKDYPDVDPFDLSIEEWHQEAQTPSEWATRVRQEFERRSIKKVQSKTESPDELSTRIRAEVEATYKAQREEDAKKASEQEAALKAQAAELAEIKRLQQEQLNRSNGMDRTHESVGEPGTPAASTKIARKLAAIPDEWLNSKDPALQKKYSEAINSKALRDELIADAQARQSK